MKYVIYIFFLLLGISAHAGTVVCDDSLDNIYVEDKNGNLHNAGRLIDVLANKHSKTNATEIRAAVKAKIESLADTKPLKAAEVLEKAESRGIVIAPDKRSKIVAARINEQLKQLTPRIEIAFDHKL